MPRRAKALALLALSLSTALSRGDGLIVVLLVERLAGEFERLVGLFGCVGIVRPAERR